jgi:hypothetical protein
MAEVNNRWRKLPAIAGTATKLMRLTAAGIKIASFFINGPNPYSGDVPKPQPYAILRGIAPQST